MRKFMFLALLLAAPVFGQDQTADLRTAAGCGPNKTQFSVKTDPKQHSVTQPEPGKAVVYVIEQGKPEGGEVKVTTRVGLDGNWVGANHGQSSLSFAVEPGEHHLCVDWQSSLKSRQKLSGAANLTAEAGKAYYFRTEVVLTQATESHDERLSIKAVDAAEGILLVSKSVPSNWKMKN
ncbi:MAG TPA: hypothetical protein VK728_00180 [Candidatus Sulfotelmatobacter sp.]|jgi:hypothetical protein|nr:hypothetical protein [Candidatus Sulfotelmatobacter sp.]